METVVPLLGPSVPALGMRSAQDPSTLPPGIWSRLENLRSDRGTLRVRNGAVAAVASAIPRAEGCRGMFSATMEGATFELAAFRVVQATGTPRTITAATNASPIVVTTSADHGFTTGDLATIGGVLGNSAANGVWTVTVLSSTTFSLNGSVGNGAYTLGGTSASMSLTTSVYRLNPAGNAWTEITSGTTRFLQDGEVGFAVVRDPGVPGAVQAARDVLVFGNGKEAPRVAYQVAGTFAVGKHEGPPVPEWATVSALPYGWMEMGATKSVFGYSPQTDFDLRDNYPSNQLPALAVESTADDGDEAVLLFRNQTLYSGSTIVSGLTLQKEVVVASLTRGDRVMWDFIRRFDLLLDPETPVDKVITAVGITTRVEITSPAHGFLDGDYVRVFEVTGSVVANGTWRVINKTTDTFELEGSPATGTGAGGKVRKLGWENLWDLSSTEDNFSLETLAPMTGTSSANMAAISTSGLEGRTGWSGIRLVASGPTPNTTFPLYLVGTSGQLDGRSLFAVSFYGQLSRAEGPALEATRKQGSALRAFGGVTSGGRFRWEPTTFRTTYRLLFSGSQALMGAPNYGLIYRSDPYLAEDGSTQFGGFLFSGAEDLPPTLPIGSNSKSIANTALDDVTRSAPEVGTLPIPSGNLFLSVNDRLWVAGTSTFTELWVSADRNPFNFRQIPLTDDGGGILSTSATYRTFGNEKVTALYPLHGEILAVDSVALWTDRGMYRLGGFSAATMLQAARLSEWGTLRAPTVTAYGGTLWYLDTEASVRQSNGGLTSESMTIGRVDDILRGANLEKACAVAGYESYRLFLQEAGETAQTSCLVWQSQVSEWALDVYPFAIEGCNFHYSAPVSRLYAAEGNGKLWHLDVPGQETDGATPIHVEMEGAELSNGLWAPVTFGAMGIVLDGAVETTLHTKRWVPYTATPYLGTVNLENGMLSTPSVWRWDSLGAGTQICFSCIPSVCGELPGGRRIRALVIKMNGIKAGGADRV